MQINTNSVRPPTVVTNQAEAVKTRVRQERAPDFAESAALDNAMHETPDVRQEEVERAARLVENENYPPPEMLDRLSKLLADNLIADKDEGKPDPF